MAAFNVCKGVDTQNGTPLSYHLALEGSRIRIDVSLAHIKSTLKSDMHEARTVGNKSGSNHLMKLLKDIYDTLALVIMKKEKLKYPLIPIAKKLKNKWQLFE